MTWNNADIFLSGSVFSTVPAGAATVILWDSTADHATGVTLSIRKGYPEIKRALVRVFMDQAATFFSDDLVLISSTWRTFNGGGAGEAIAANTWFERDVLLPAQDHRLRILTATVPTVWEVSVKLSPDRALAQ